jgi:hypothetical protein
MVQNRRRTIELHIEELVLDGFPVQDGDVIATTVRQELGRLMSEGDVPSRLMQSNDIGQLDISTVELESGTDAEATGRRIAASIYGGLQQ